MAALFVGMSKTGIQGLTIIAIPLLAMVFGAKPSTGLMLPILCFADLIGVTYYRRQGWYECMVLPVCQLLETTFTGFRMGQHQPDDTGY